MSLQISSLEWLHQRETHHEPSDKFTRMAASKRNTLCVSVVYVFNHTYDKSKEEDGEKI